jgi:hypothetical protein
MLRGLTDKEAKELVRLLQKAVASGNELSRAPLHDAATAGLAAENSGIAPVNLRPMRRS